MIGSPLPPPPDILFMYETKIKVRKLANESQKNDIQSEIAQVNTISFGLITSSVLVDGHPSLSAGLVDVVDKQLPSSLTLRRYRPSERVK